MESDLNTKKCSSCGKTSTQQNASYCCFCGIKYTYICVNMCECNQNVISDKNCSNCHSNPTIMTEEEFNKYYKNLDESYLSAKKEFEKIKERFNKVHREKYNLKCFCSKYEKCDSCIKDMYDW